MSPIIDLQRRLVEVGRIRMGKKGDCGQPQKLDTWRLTSRDRERLDAIAAQHGGTVRPWAEREGEFEIVTTTDELPIMLLPGQTLSQWHEFWSGGGCLRRCDGEREILSDSPCVCDTDTGARKCKPTTRLSVMLPDIPGLGCWRLESHGFYAAVELAATAHMLEQATARGQLLPARLRIDQRRQVKDGKTTRYAVPVIDIDITMREALPLAGNGDAALAHTPVRRALASVSVEAGLAGAAASAAPRSASGRAAAPIPAAANLEFGSAVPVDDGPTPPASATLREREPKMAKKLDVLVGKLRDASKLTTQHLWQAVGRDFEPSEDGLLHWGPLRDQLTREEASTLIDRLERFERSSVASTADAASSGPVAGDGDGAAGDTGRGEQAAQTPAAAAAPEEEAVWQPVTTSEEIATAARMVVPRGVHKGKTLAEVADIVGGEAWLLRQLKDVPPAAPARESLETFTRALLPDVWAAYQAWLA